MKALLTALLLVGVAACGKGGVIFNVDVLSFIQPSGKDTIPYNVPAPIPVSADSFITPQKVSLPSGLGNSSVDSVQVTGAAIIENATGTGNIDFEIYFAKDSDQVYLTTPYVSANGVISGTQPSTVQLLPPTAVSLSDSVFNTNELWVGIHAGIGANAGPNLTGRVRVTLLTLRVALRDQIF
jgi:hypothetical protein